MSSSNSAHRPHEHAVVIGGSIAGLLAARVLAGHFARVTIVERDRLPDDASFRSGAPQAHHAHTLLAQGQEIIEGLLPGFGAELEAAGAVPFDPTLHVRTLLPGGWSPSVPSGLRVLAASRSLIESVVRRHVLALSGVTTLQSCDVADLVFDATGQRVTGVTVQARLGRARGRETLSAELVVDASGRSSRAPAWLEQHGFGTVEQQVVSAQVGYATRWYEAPPGVVEQRQSLWVQMLPGRGTRGGLLMPMENGKMVVTLFGAADDCPPTDEEGFEAFAHSLPTRAIYNTMKRARPLTHVYSFRRTENRLRRYDRMARFPDGFAVLGDACAALNPSHGQGMTAAALEAVALDETLRRRPASLNGVSRDFQKRLARVIVPLWQATAADDLRWPGSVGGALSPRARLRHRYTDHLRAQFTRRPELYVRFVRAAHGVEPGRALYGPRAAASILYSALRPARRPATIMQTQEMRRVPLG